LWRLVSPTYEADLPAYARAFLDLLSGGSALSVRGDEAEEAWRIVTPRCGRGPTVPCRWTTTPPARTVRRHLAGPARGDTPSALGYFVPPNSEAAAACRGRAGLIGSVNVRFTTPSSKSTPRGTRDHSDFRGVRAGRASRDGDGLRRSPRLSQSPSGRSFVGPAAPALVREESRSLPSPRESGSAEASSKRGNSTRTSGALARGASFVL
jgi:hypothetical protein